MQDSRIENNLIYDNHASGISLYQIDGADGLDRQRRRQQHGVPPSDGRWALNIQDGTTGNTVLNNILVTDHSFRGALDISADSLPGFISDYNVVVSRFTTDGGDTVMSLAQWQTATGHDAHSLVATRRRHCS